MANLPLFIEARPAKISEIIGQDKGMTALKDFVLNFSKEKFNSAIISGPTGCGKTAGVYALANELNLEIIEINASDFRNKDNIENVVGSASQQQSLFMRKKIILVDEIDGISGSKDRGGLSALAKTVAKSKFPIVMTANDISDKKFKDVRKNSLIIEFNTLSAENVLEIIRKALKKTGADVNEKVLGKLSYSSGGDARAALNDLHILDFKGNEITEEALEMLSFRDKKRVLSDILRIVFKTTDPNVALRSFDSIDIDYDEAIMWIDENLPLEYRKPEFLANAYDFLSKADIFRRRIKNRQYWRFLVYIKAFISAGIAVSKTEKSNLQVEYKRSSRPLSYWIMNNANKYRDSIAEKLAEKIHVSSKFAKKEIIPYILAISKNKNFFDVLKNEFQLDSQEIKWINTH